MTVSLALRQSPQIGSATRERVIALAKQHGYKPDPAISRLMSIVRSKRIRKTGITIGYLNSLPRRELLQEIPTFRAFFEGARERSEELGYHLEEFWTRSRGMSDRRLTDVLVSRGIEGVLVGPRWLEDPLLKLDWSRFCAVVVGDVVYDPGLTRVSSHRFHGAVMLFDQLARRGYRRIVCVISDEYDKHHDHEMTLAIQHFHLVNPLWKIEIIPLVETTWDFDRFAKRFKELRPDAVVSLYSNVYDWLLRLGRRIPEDVGYANFDCPPDREWSGIDQNSRYIGRLALDLGSMLLRTGSTGVPESPSITLVEGRWHEGATLVPLAPPKP